MDRNVLPHSQDPAAPVSGDDDPSVVSPGACARRDALIREMFLDTADTTYIGARAAFFERRDLDFWWLTLQAAETYMKAALLLNGQTADRPDHNLTVLLRRLRSIDPRLSPPSFVRPALAGPRGWFETPSDQFFSNLAVYGAATNRYAAYSHVTSNVDLFRADHLVYWARRFARPFHQTLADGREINWVDELTKEPRVWRHPTPGPLEQLADMPGRDSAKQTFLRANMAFFPKKRHRRPQRRGSPVHEAAILRSVNTLRKSRAGSAERAQMREVLQWTLAHIYLPDAQADEIKALLAARP